jgi:hypothetical protein
LTRVLPILRKNGTLFKVPARLEYLAALNSGIGQFSQVGKFLTVYPQTDTEAVDLALALHTATRGLQGPHIPFDAHFRKNSLVYYRYGTFLGSAIDRAQAELVDPSGRPRRDVRDLAHAIPHWARSPFSKSRPIGSLVRARALLGLDLLPVRALGQRGKGGVYEALDIGILPTRFVILKEGRRHGETDWLGDDGYARVKREARVLRVLARHGVPVPGVLREFSQEGNRYLVLEKIPGRPLISRRREQPANFSWRRAARLLDQLSPMLDAIHQAGYVWRDCKPEHVFVHRGAMRLLDFEGACRIEETDILPWGSTHYLPPIYCKKFAARSKGTLEDDYALGVIVFQFATGEFPQADPRRRAQCYRRAACPNLLRDQIEALLRY